MTKIVLLAFEMNTNSYNCISYKFSYLRHKYMGIPLVGMVVFVTLS